MDLHDAARRVYSLHKITNLCQLFKDFVALCSTSDFLARSLRGETSASDFYKHHRLKMMRWEYNLHVDKLTGHSDTSSVVVYTLYYYSVLI